MNFVGKKSDNHNIENYTTKAEQRLEWMLPCSPLEKIWNMKPGKEMIEKCKHVEEGGGVQGGGFHYQIIILPLLPT